jgi:hypothetical protein
MRTKQQAHGLDSGGIHVHQDETSEMNWAGDAQQHEIEKKPIQRWKTCSRAGQPEKQREKSINTDRDQGMRPSSNAWDRN